MPFLAVYLTFRSPPPRRSRLRLRVGRKVYAGVQDARALTVAQLHDRSKRLRAVECERVTYPWRFGERCLGLNVKQQPPVFVYA